MTIFEAAAELQAVGAFVFLWAPYRNALEILEVRTRRYIKVDEIVAYAPCLVRDEEVWRAVHDHVVGYPVATRAVPQPLRASAV